ncbi:hypothetical protein C8Q76DRAFT_798950 [Earliella scabrosa]|nr:hypothetical protein C8Q76DRAFT_798950 [Earliella scabrosa]
MSGAPSYAQYEVRLAQPLPGRPGEMDDGTLSVDLPLVARYVQYVCDRLLQADAAHAALPNTAPWHEAEGWRVNWWKAELGGIVRDHTPPKPRRSKKGKKKPSMWDTDDDYSDEEEDARERMAAGLEKSWEDVLEHVEGAMVEFGHAGKSTMRLKKAIFALAALSVFCFPQQPAHWAFWAKNSRWTTARLVNEVIGECLACPLCRSHPTDKDLLPLSTIASKWITVPRGVAWTCVEYAVSVVTTFNKGYLPSPDTHPSVLKAKRDKRKALPKAAPLTATTTSANPTETATNANEKRVADDGVEAPQAKRARRATQGEPASSGETSKVRKSCRLARKAVVEAPQQPSLPVEVADEVTNEVVDEVPVQEEVVIDVEMVDETGEAEALVDVQTDVPVAPKKKAPARRSKKPARKAKGTRKAAAPKGKGKATKDTTTAEQLQLYIDPSASTLEDIPISFVEPMSTSSTPSTPVSAPSPESTVVSAPMSSDESTRVGTPMEATPKVGAKLELAAVTAKLVLSAIPPPRRMSQRTRAKKMLADGTFAGSTKSQ